MRRRPSLLLVCRRDRACRGHVRLQRGFRPFHPAGDRCGSSGCRAIRPPPPPARRDARGAGLHAAGDGHPVLLLELVPVSRIGQRRLPCLVTEEMLSQLPGGTGVPSFNLGTGQTASFTNSIDPALLTAVCGGMLPGQPERLNCTGGFPIQITLTIDNGVEEVKAVSTVRLRFTPTATLDPPIYGLEPRTPSRRSTPSLRSCREQRRHHRPAGDDLPRFVGTSIRRRSTRATAVETYDGADKDGNPATLTERLFITWYVETGDWMTTAPATDDARRPSRRWKTTSGPPTFSRAMRRRRRVSSSSSTITAAACRGRPAP